MDDGDYYLENFIDCVVMNVFYFVDGNEDLVMDLVDEIVY